MKNAYFDTEFTDLKKDAELISLGIVIDTNKFYAEFTDFNKKKCSDFVKEHVLPNTITNAKKENTNLLAMIQNKKVTYVQGTKAEIKDSLIEWLKRFGNEPIQFISDCGHYDMVLLIDIFGSAFDLPSNISACLHDINQDIAKRYGISDKMAFDINREELQDYIVSVPLDIVIKHNALYDAMVIKDLHAILSHYSRRDLVND